MHLSDYQISMYIEKKLMKEEEKKIKEHLNQCRECFEKAFFLKKALIEEEKLLTRELSIEKERKSFINVIKNKVKIISDGLKLIKENILVKELTLSFRNTPITKAIEIDLGPKIHIFYNEGAIKISSKNDLSDITIETDKGEIFKGFLPSDVEIKIEKNEFLNKFIITFNKNRIEFELDV